MEEPGTYIKGVTALVVLTLVFRVLDIALNWNFLSTHPDYVPFLQVDVSYVIAGAAVIPLFLRSVKGGIAGGLVYGASGIALTIFDPDFTHFVRAPLEMFSMDAVVSMMFTFGTLVLAVMMVLAHRAYLSLIEGSG